MVLISGYMRHLTIPLSFLKLFGMHYTIGQMEYFTRTSTMMHEYMIFANICDFFTGGSKCTDASRIKMGP